MIVNCQSIRYQILPMNVVQKHYPVSSVKFFAILPQHGCQNSCHNNTCSTVYNVPKLLEITGDGKLNVALSDDPMYAKVQKYIPFSSSHFFLAALAALYLPLVVVVNDSLPL